MAGEKKRDWLRNLH